MIRKAPKKMGITMGNHMELSITRIKNQMLVN